MLKCYFIVVILFNTRTFTAAGETPAPTPAPTPTPVPTPTTTPTPAPVPLKQFDNIAYEITNNHKEDVVKVYIAFGWNADVIKYWYVSYPEGSILTLQTPKDAGGVYVMIRKIPGYKDITITPFSLNKTVPLNFEPNEGSDTYLVEGDKLIHIKVHGDKTLKTVWEFSDDQVRETLASGDAKASRVWKALKTVNSKQ